MERRKIAVGFVVYNPKSSTIDRINNAVSWGFVAYIFDNSPEKSVIRDYINCRKNINYTTGGKNLGLGMGLSVICSQAYYDSHHALVFFDQDTLFNIATLNTIEEFYVNNQHLISDYSAVVFNSSNFNVGGNEFVKCFIDVPLARNSGSLFYLENLKKINWHNEKYFVDGVDYEFCLKSRHHNFRIGEYSCTPGFDHAIEQEDKKYIIFGKTYSMRAYSLRRIIDTANSSLKIISKSVCYGEIQFTARIIKLSLIYMMTQLIVRFLSKIIDETI